MKRRPLSLLLASVALLLVGVLGATAAVFASSDGLLRPGGPVSAGVPADDRGVERILLPAGRYLVRTPFGIDEWSDICGPRLLLGVRDGDGWLLSDGVSKRHYAADQRINPLPVLPLQRKIRLAVYWDPRGSDQPSLDMTLASVKELLPLYVSLYTGGALQVSVELRGETFPSAEPYLNRGQSFNGPDLDGIRDLTEDEEVPVVLSVADRTSTLRGYADLSIPGGRGAFFIKYYSDAYSPSYFKHRTGLSLDRNLSLQSLRGAQLLDVLSMLPFEAAQTIAVSWHELLHVLEWRALPKMSVHDYTTYAHDGAEEEWTHNSVEISWYGIVSAQLLGGGFLTPSQTAFACIEPIGLPHNPPSAQGTPTP